MSSSDLPDGLVPINAGLMVKCRFCGHAQILPPGGGQLGPCCEKLVGWPAERASEVYEIRMIPNAETAAMQ